LARNQRLENVKVYFTKAEFNSDGEPVIYRNCIVCDETKAMFYIISDQDQQIMRRKAITKKELENGYYDPEISYSKNPDEADRLALENLVGIEKYRLKDMERRTEWLRNSIQKVENFLAERY